MIRTVPEKMKPTATDINDNFQRYKITVKIKISILHKMCNNQLQKSLELKVFKGKQTCGQKNLIYERACCKIEQLFIVVKAVAAAK